MTTLSETPQQRAARATVRARLEREGPREMTAAANASARHVKSLARWEELAREQNPGLGDDAVMRCAEQLRTEHYRAMGKRSAQVRGSSVNASPRSVTSPQRWLLLAREQNPGLGDEAVITMAAAMRAEHYRRIWQTRRASAVAGTREA